MGSCRPNPVVSIYTDDPYPLQRLSAVERRPQNQGKAADG